MKCKLDNITIYYELYGKGYPILMIHGFMPDHRLMKGCLEPIFENKNNYKRIYFDLPGMGKTSAPDWLNSSDEILDIVLDFIDKIIPNEKFIIASESYGSYLARSIILKRSDSIDGVLFICPLIIPQPEKRDLPKEVRVFIKDKNLISNLNPLDVEELEESLVIQTREVWERYKEEVLSGIRIADQNFVDKVFPANYSFSFDVDQLLKLYDKPSLFILGRQDITVGYRDAWNIIEKYPRATFAILDQAGHNLQIERANLFNCLVVEWLERVKCYISSKDKN